MTNQVARMGFLPSPIYGRGAGGEGASAHSTLSPALSHKWEREQSARIGSPL